MLQEDVLNGFSFGDFRLDATHRRLIKNGESVNLKSKTFDLLLALVENRDRVVSKDELLDRVWENQMVEENNLTVHVAALRKALGEKKGDHRFIITVPGKGYRFVSTTNGHELEREIVVEHRKIERYVEEETIEQNVPSRLWPLWATLSVAVVGVAAAWYGLSSGAAPKAQAGELTLETFSTSGVPHRVAISHDGDTLAYVRRFKGKDSIWLGNIAAKSNIQITPDSNRLYESIEFSPDGKTLYFIARDENHLDRTLMSLPIYGGATRPMISKVLGSRISNDGKFVGYIKKDEAGDSALYIADAETAGGEQLIYQPTAPVRFANNGVSWSPKSGGLTVAISGDDGKGCDFAEVVPSTSAMKRLGTGLCGDSTNFAWLKDGSGIVMTGRETLESRSQILLADPAKNERRPITNDMAIYGPYSISSSADGRLAVLQQKSAASVWVRPVDSPSPQGATRILQGSGSIEGNHGLEVAPDRRLLYTVRSAKVSSIWDADLDGGSPREIIPASGDADNVQMDVTADNRFIVFESSRSGKSEIWRANRDGSNQVMLTNGGGNQAPSLSIDGKTILYMSTRDGIPNIWSVDINGEKPDQLTFTSCSWPVVSPDGSSFACATGSPSDGPKRLLAIYPFGGGKPRREFKVAQNSALYNRLHWSPDGRSIVYKDTVDGLWQQNATGGDPLRLPGFEDERVYHFTFGPEGQLIYSGGVQMRQITLIGGFN